MIPKESTVTGSSAEMRTITIIGRLSGASSGIGYQLGGPPALQ